MVKVRVPATSANLGCGFDTLGIALTLYTEFEFEIIENGVEFYGFPKEYANEKNLVYTSLKKTLNILNKKISGVKISVKSKVPISRGLGSSATCVVGGIYGAYLLTETKINKDEIFNIATQIEGHPDNVSPAIYGGLSASCLTENKEALTVKYNIDDRFIFLALVPNFETSTEQARLIMPNKYIKQDVIYSLSRLGVVLKAFETYDKLLLKKATGDKIHEPYRKKIINEYNEVKNICESIDSISFLISGSGSTLLNIIENEENIEKIELKLKKLKHNWQIIKLKADTKGTVVI